MSSYWVEVPRDVVRVSGADAATYLQSQLSQDLRSLAVGASAWSFVLQPTGRVDVLARIRRTGDDEFHLDTDAGFGQVLVARLQRFKIRVAADIDVVEGWRCLAVRPDGAALDGSGELSDVVVGWGGGVDLLGPAVEPPAATDEGTAERLEAARIDAVWPAMGSEIVPGETIPAETGITAVAVSFTKGCYPGQELVERMDSRGASAPRLLQRVEVPAGTGVGDAVERDGSMIGVVTSVAGTAALAYVKRSALDQPSAS